LGSSYQRQRLQAKKDAERKARRRARRKKQALQWSIGAAVVALLAIVLIVSLAGGKKPLANPSATPTLSPTPTPTACTKIGRSTVGQKTFGNPPCLFIDPKKTYTATLTTSMGVIKVKLFSSAAPNTVNNFVFLAENKFYDGSIFHRVIPDFGGKGTDMIQGGDAVKRDGTGGPGYTFSDENAIPLTQKGYLAMANSGANTNGSQFFFLSGPDTQLNAAGTCPGGNCYNVFGQVTSGLNVISAIAHVKRDASDKPLSPVTLISVKITS
jgi:cyclophilin family peptidyl-prolyl cis-trans isomerase